MNLKQIQTVVTATVLSLVATTSLATETRMSVLRYNGGVQDETLVFSYPGQIGKYNIALVELGTKSSGTKGAYGAAFVDLGSNSVGVAISRTEWLFTSGWSNNSPLNSSQMSLFDLYQSEATRSTNSAGCCESKFSADSSPSYRSPNGI